MSPAASVAVDVGTLTTKVAVARAGAAPQLSSLTTAAGSGRVFLSEVVAKARAQLGGRLPQICFAVPDSWLSAEVAGGQAYEEFRHVVEDEMGLAELSWIGHAPAVTAAAADRWPDAGDGRYLICDIGGSGVRAAVCEVTGQEIRLVAACAAVGDGEQEFGTRALAAAQAESDLGPAGWHAQIRQQPRLALVLERAVADPSFLDTPACTLVGANRSYGLTGGQLVDSFAPTAERLRAGISAVLAGERPAVAVLTGGLGWFPLAARAVAEAAGVAPKIADPQAAAAGALLVCRGVLHLAPISGPPVHLPVHQVKHGLLEEERLELPWTRSFASLGGEPLVLDTTQVPLEISGRPRTVRLPGLTPGSYLIGVRPGSPWRGLLVLREADSDDAVHISPLDLECPDDR